MDDSVLDAAILDVTVLDATVLDVMSLAAALLDAAFLDAVVLDVAALDAVNAPYTGDFGCFFGCYELWMPYFWMLRTLDSTALDASIRSQKKPLDSPISP